MSIYVSILEMKRLLVQLDHCIDKAVAYAATKKFDPNVLVQARLAPDMFAFARQVQATCDQAKYAASRLAGREPPSHPDTEQTMDELKKRIATVVGYLSEFSEQDFAGVAERTVTTPRWEGKSMTAINYLVEHAQPNFFFHLTTAYAILRHNGVDIGKRDYLAPLTWR
jgi:uncharacterized protein